MPYFSFPHHPMPSIANFLRAYRKSHGLSILKLVQHTGILPQVLQYIEAGRGSPHMNTVIRLQKAGILPQNLSGITFPERKPRKPPASPPPPPPPPAQVCALEEALQDGAP
ncbi:MAG: hypothetical protein [Siphoviridae sp. ctpQM7]|nr:MAG: hypothetical protein [Siphoviridae sp. ctpQM7]